MPTTLRYSLATLLIVALAACSGAPEQQKDDYVDKMAKEHKDDTPDPAAAGDDAMGDTTGVASERVVYGSIDGKPLNGVLAMPESGAEGLPGIIVIHEWWGLNDNVETMAKRLAKEGYVTLAVDLYGGQSADKPDKARELMQKAMEIPELGDKNLEQALAYLKDKGATDIGTIGWCFGGAWSLRAAIHLQDAVDATVIYYGHLETDKERLDRVKAPILGLFGGADKGIPVDTVKAFRATMGELDKTLKVKIYDGAGHAFANPSGQNYEAEAARDAWDKTLSFFEEHLGAGEDQPAMDTEPATTDEPADG